MFLLGVFMGYYQAREAMRSGIARSTVERIFETLVSDMTDLVAKETLEVIDLGEGRRQLFPVHTSPGPLKVRRLDVDKPFVLNMQCLHVREIRHRDLAAILDFRRRRQHELAYIVLLSGILRHTAARLPLQVSTQC